MERKDILKIVLDQVELLKETFSKEQQFEVNDNTILFGKNSNIDSLSLVSLIVDLESIFFDEFNLEISLTDDNAMTRKISPFDTISTLTDYILEVVNN